MFDLFVLKITKTRYANNNPTIPFFELLYLRYITTVLENEPRKLNQTALSEKITCIRVDVIYKDSDSGHRIRTH